MPIMHRGDLYLVPQTEVDALASTGLPSDEVRACLTVAAWARTFLIRDHPELGREGPVCPFTQPSLNKNLFWIGPHSRAPLDEAAAADAVRGYLDWFLTLEPVSGPDTVYKTILIVFPLLASTEAADVLTPLQRHLKADFVKRGLMVGQFYEGCQEPGLWNRNFRPLQSPIPLLAIRNMVPSDFPFLHGSRGNSEMLLSYFSHFGHNIPPQVRHLITKALEDYESRHPDKF